MSRQIFRRIFAHKHNRYDEYQAHLNPIDISVSVTYGEEANDHATKHTVQIEVTISVNEAALAYLQTGKTDKNTSSRADIRKITYTIEKTDQEFWQFRSSLEADLRFSDFPCKTASKVLSFMKLSSKQQSQLTDFLDYLCVKNLNQADRNRLFAFLEVPTEILNSKSLNLTMMRNLSIEETKTAQSSEGEEQSDEENAEEDEDEDDILAHLEAPENSKNNNSSSNKGEDQVVIGVKVDIFDKFIDDLRTNYSGPSETHADPNPPDDLRIIRNVRYRDLAEAEEEGAQKNCLDLYLPAQKQNSTKKTGMYPVVVHVHGGGWVRGDRQSFFYGAPPLSAGYARNGCVVVTPSYRLGHYPDHIDDVVSAVRWAVANIEAYGGDATRVFLSGHSAGGNIVSLMGCSKGINERLNLAPGSLKGVVAISGVYDLFRPMDKKWKNSVFRRRYIRPTFGLEETTVVQNSPSCLLRMHLGAPALAVECKCPIKKLKAKLHQKQLVEQEEKNQSAGGCASEIAPFFVLSAAYDLGLERDAVTFAILLKKCGVDVQSESIKDCNHPSICWEDLTVRKVVAWMKLHADLSCD